MSEIATRGSAPRGRGSFRGGRGGHSSRGGRGGRTTGGDRTAAAAEPAIEDQGEIGQLKNKYASSVTLVKEMFPDWTNEDIVFAIEENGGDLEQTINRMSEGNVSQWGEVKKKEKTKTSKVGEAAAGASTRGGRGRGGAESTRGGRGRATERGRGASRGARGGSTANGKAGIAKAVDTSATEASLGDVAATGASTEVPTAASPSDSWEVVAPAEAAPPVTEATKTTPKPDATRTWASMLKPVAKPKPAPTAKPIQPIVPQAQEQLAPAVEPPSMQEPSIEPAIPSVVEPNEQMPPSAPPSLPPSESTSTTVIPSEDKLTEENLEQVKDVSHPLASETVTSTVDTEEPRSVVGTPLHGQSSSAVRPGLSGFATSAIKATQGGSRSASFRRVKDQQEAVVMPGNHAVDRAAVQFGSLGISGAEDVDDDREEAETRTQPPQHSPIAPRASLPATAQQLATEPTATPRAAPGLPSDLPQVTQGDAQTTAAAPSQYDQFSNRFGGLPGAQVPGATNVSKPYEPFGQQLAGAGAGAGHHPFDNYSSQSQAPGHQGQTAPSNPGGFGSGYDSYYNDYQRNAHLYGGFGHQQGQTSHESSAAQRSAGAFGSSAADQQSQYATSQGQHNRFGGVSEALNSGHSTPAPAAGQPGHGQAQAQTQAQAHNQSAHAGNHGQAGAPYGQYGQYAGGYNSPFSYGQMSHNNQSHQPYGRDRPAYDDARRYEENQQYMSSQGHYGYGGYGNYGGGPYSGGKYGQPHQYGGGYDTHGASQANSYGRDSGAGNFGYARTGSAQPENAQQSQHGSLGYGGLNDPFGRGASGFPGQTSSQQGQGATGDDSSRFGTDSNKIATGGPSPAPGQQRPDSAANVSQAGQSQGQQAYGSYPHNLGGFGGHQAGHQSGHQAGQQGYAGFGGAGYGYSYGGNSGNRGGWSNYGGGH